MTHQVSAQAKDWRTPQNCLILMALAMPFSHAVWMALINNFAVEAAAFSGREIGILQSLREVPGFLSFTAVFIILFIREQSLAVLSLTLLGLGVLLTGYFPSEYGIYATGLLMSIGFHYYETMQMSLSLQWIPKGVAPKALGRQMSATSVGALAAYAMLWLVLEFFGLDYAWLYAAAGLVTIGIAAYVWLAFPKFESHTVQHRHMVLRSRYWLYYALTFMGGARRQIFVVFGGFLLVTKFGYTAAEITGLYLLNHLVTTFFAPQLGKFIIRFGERKVLIFEYVGLMLVFYGYAVVETAMGAAVLYVLDHIFFAFAIAQKSYLQKIADARDIAATSSVSFSINHIAAVVIPVLFGTYLWSASPSYVFYAGTAMAFISLMLAMNIPHRPEPGNEVMLGHRGQPQAAE